MKKLIDLIQEQFDDSSIIINADSIISDIDGFDSLTAFSIIDSIEEEYGIQIDEADLNKSVEEIFKLINE
jgi:acyl carrier protein